MSPACLPAPTDTVTLFNEDESRSVISATDRSLTGLPPSVKGAPPRANSDGGSWIAGSRINPTSAGSSLLTPCSSVSVISTVRTARPSFCALKVIAFNAAS